MLGTFKELEAISVYIRLYKDYKTIKTKREKKIKKFRKNKKRHGTSRTGGRQKERTEFSSMESVVQSCFWGY